MDRKLIAIAVLFLVFAAAPYLLAWGLPAQGFVFGGFLFNPIDGNSYLAKMMEGWRGEWLFTLPYTAEKGSGALLFLFYITLGHLARLASLPLGLVFHLARMIGVMFFLWECLRFIPTFFPSSPKQAREGLAYALFGSGLGWVFIFFGIILSDVWVAEAYPFLSGFSSPHFIIGMGLLIQIFRDLLQPESIWQYGRLAVWGLLLAVIMPFGLVVACGVAGIWQVVEWRVMRSFHWKALAALALLGGLALLYQYWVILQDPLLSQWNTQNQTPSPNLADLLLSFAPGILLAAWGAWSWIRTGQTSAQQRLLLVWLVAGILLTYVPFSLQRRFLFALFLPVAILAVAGMQALRQQKPAWMSRLTPAIWISSVLTNGVVILLALFGVLSHQPQFYLSQDETEAFRFIQSSLPEDALVLCSSETGLFIPAWTGRRVIYGHEFETFRAASQEELVDSFWSGAMDTSQTQAFLKEHSIDYVFAGPRERKLGDPMFLSSLKPVFQNASVAIYAR